MNRTVLAATTLAAGIALLAAGCSGSANSAAASKSRTETIRGALNGAAALKSGTETISGTLKGEAAMATNPVFHLTFSGPVNTTGTFPLGASPRTGQTHTFKTTAGNLVIVTGTSSATQRLLSTSTCRFEFSTTVPYTVSGAHSTGQFAGASGSGKARVGFVGNLPKLSSGKCNTSTTAVPKVSTVVSTFKATGPMTIK